MRIPCRHMLDCLREESLLWLLHSPVSDLVDLLFKVPPFMVQCSETRWGAVPHYWFMGGIFWASASLQLTCTDSEAVEWPSWPSVLRPMVYRLPSSAAASKIIRHSLIALTTVWMVLPW